MKHSLNGLSIFSLSLTLCAAASSAMASSGSGPVKDIERVPGGFWFAPVSGYKDAAKTRPTFAAAKFIQTNEGAFPRTGMGTLNGPRLISCLTQHIDINNDRDPQAQLYAHLTKIQMIGQDRSEYPGAPGTLAALKDGVLYLIMDSTQANVQGHSLCNRNAKGNMLVNQAYASMDGKPGTGQSASPLASGPKFHTGFADKHYAEAVKAHMAIPPIDSGNTVTTATDPQSEPSTREAIASTDSASTGTESFTSQRFSTTGPAFPISRPPVSPFLTQRFSALGKPISISHKPALEDFDFRRDPALSIRLKLQDY